MPRKPKRPCSFLGCPKLTDGRFCEEHEKQENRRYEKYDRDPVVRRRYGRAWKRIRDRYAAKHPFCEECRKKGLLRPVAGRKPKALTEKISEGKTVEVLMEPAELEGMDVPPVKDFLKSPQKSGRELVAEEVYNETYVWLKARGCEKLVTVQMVEQYAMSVSRWIQCEEIVSSTGFLAKHPTTGAAIASPYVSMSQSYMKQTNYCWMQIYQIVKENCSVEFQGNTPQDDVMERLLRARKGV